MLRRRSFVKAQLNFVEEMCFKLTKHRVSSLLAGPDEELGGLFPEYLEYAAEIRI